MEKAKEGNVPETFRSWLRLCDGEERLVGVETRSARVAVGLRLTFSTASAQDTLSFESENDHGDSWL